jgi:hypothetical protein
MARLAALFRYNLLACSCNMQVTLKRKSRQVQPSAWNAACSPAAASLGLAGSYRGRMMHARGMQQPDRAELCF